MTDSDASGHVTMPAQDSDVTFSFSETVDPIVDAVFSLRGRVSKRRYLNILRMRYKKMLQECNLDPAWIRQALRRLNTSAVNKYVDHVLQPGYGMTHASHLVDPASAARE